VRVKVPEVAVAVPEHVPFVNQLNVTVPVGTGKEPFAVSVALS
jgi:hypothetical protein